MVSVPKTFPGSTIVCIASGPSLTLADVEACRGRATVVAVNDASRLAPWADCVYACDRRWWEAHPETQALAGLKYGLRAVPSRPDVQILQQGSDRGISLDPSVIHTGKNSGYQAVNVAVHLGAARILLLGYDMQPGPKGRMHFFGADPWNRHLDTPFVLFRALFETLVEPLKAAGIAIVNCTRETALTCIPRQSLEEALALAPVAV